jgi:DNA processing protein
LLDRTGVNDASELFSLTVPELLKIDGFGKNIAKSFVEFDDWNSIDKILETTEKSGATLVSIDNENYPELLRHIYDPPLILWVKGNPETLKTDGIAVIGTRRASKYGLVQAEKWAATLVDAGLCINSGLAYGVDAQAHKSALNAGGKTIAVLGSGIDVIYPAKNRKIAGKIIQSGGAIISEFPPGTPPDAVNFPERNRIVSGMSHGVLVVESGVKGGSMITARCALDQNREVFVVPHQLDYGRGEGCNYLIRTGQGKLIQYLPDVMDEISVQTGEVTERSPTEKKWRSLELDEDAEEICILLENEDLHIDQISEQTGKPTFKLHSILLDLEMNGAVRQRAGKYFELC